MGIFLMFIGFGWAILGFGNIFSMPWGESSTNFITFGFIFNMILFVAPGLIVGGLGCLVNNRKNNNVDSSTMMKCPQCAELIKKEASICRFCNLKVKPMITS